MARGLLLLAGKRAIDAGREPVLSGPPVDDLMRRMTTEAELGPT